ncbi:hypothetical protein J3R03_005359 [Actinoplanes couchii]|uniref:DUF7919 domain-containing protein n=1 Tax=Actinoplanes couchii TaxID=403638 RepID=A0ABQ3XCM8_9ACTN|nr:hypothetical protein [Actinoplanes couchii]MDR6321163.1 hypothetical protein [Actinoplanes couchii]GID56272.1 hypothetical protein Aco03nite_046760 [Actinoplanes couchii]
MTYFADLTPYVYLDGRLVIDTDFGEIVCRPRCRVLNVGWLDVPHGYRAGVAPAGFLAALADIIAGPRMNGTRGIHDCTLCPESRRTRCRQRNTRAGACGWGSRRSGCRPARDCCSPPRLRSGTT